MDIRRSSNHAPSPPLEIKSATPSQPVSNEEVSQPIAMQVQHREDSVAAMNAAGRNNEVHLRAAFNTVATTHPLSPSSLGQPRKRRRLESELSGEETLYTHQGTSSKKTDIESQCVPAEHSMDSLLARSRELGGEGELNLRRLPCAPTKLLSFEEAMKAVDDMLADHESYPEIVPLPPTVPEDIDQRDWHEPKRTQQERWNKRLEDICEVLEGIKENAKDLAACNFIAYFVDKKPVGILIMSDDSPPLIEELVTHIGSETVGGSLIEHAVRISKEQGDDGELDLISMTEDSKKAYAALGFSQVNGDHMRLIPAESDKWEEVNGGLFLKKHLGMSYIG